jgi:phosphoribosylformylglycinamidine synthase
MIFFFDTPAAVYAVQARQQLQDAHIERLVWLLSGASPVPQHEVKGIFHGPRKEMVTPWSTNAVEITQNMGIPGILRMEEYIKTEAGTPFDPMLTHQYDRLDQALFTVDRQPEPIRHIRDIGAYNRQEGLALSDEEIEYLNQLSHRLDRPLTDSEIFGFSQVNSEHCRHKIFNGRFVIDGAARELSLFQLIKLTTQTHPNRVVSAYRDNCAFLQGPVVEQFAPGYPDRPDYFNVSEFEAVLSLKAETHNFPTTVEPFNGAATGSGGEIRDRLGGGKGAIPLAGTAVYMTSYPRLEGGRSWEKALPARPWLYHTPEDILIRASNGASDFGNKFGQPLICGSLLTFEHSAPQLGRVYGYDKVIMLAGGIGFGKKRDSRKDQPRQGDRIVLLGGDNYRIGMGGGAVSSVATGEYGNAIELNAVQRSNPEMQKRVANAIRALVELDENPVVSIHDHGAGGHLNCLSELVEDTGGKIEIERLPIGDTTLSDREIAGNESQERMGLVLRQKDLPLLKDISARERAPMYEVGEVTGDLQFTFEHQGGDPKPIDLQLSDLFGSPPKTVLEDRAYPMDFGPVEYSIESFDAYLKEVLQLEEVACKDWLINKVDRSVTGKVALQQSAGPLQLPLNNLGISALDFRGIKGVATALGHAPVSGLIDPAKGSVLSIAEALTNIVWAPIEGGLSGVSLSANWMWPCRNAGEDARLYAAVEGASRFALALGINIPTGKDSLSMTQKYADGSAVYAPGTVIISAAGEVSDIGRAVTPIIQLHAGSRLLHIDFSSESWSLGGSSLAQVLNGIGRTCPGVSDAGYFARAFEAVQALIREGLVLAGHDISAGGMITTLLEMVFSRPGFGIEIDLEALEVTDPVLALFSQNPGVVLQVDSSGRAEALLDNLGIKYKFAGRPTEEPVVNIAGREFSRRFGIDELRDLWFRTSYLLDRKQSGPQLALARYRNYRRQPLSYRFPAAFGGTLAEYGIEAGRRTSSGIRAAIIREKGINGDREMAWMMYLAGFDVKDVHMTDLVAGRETLDQVHLIVFTGGFSNSDVLGSAKGWAGAFLYNNGAREALERYFARKDTLSLGVCNGCQLMVELGIIQSGPAPGPRMLHNESGKFESRFLNVDILQNPSVMLGSLGGSRLGIWVAHGEGRFSFPGPEDEYLIPMKYTYSEFPGNPNGSQFDAAAICSHDGRHLAMMPHLERSTYPWNWAHYPEDRPNDAISPWIEAFANARRWIAGRI